MSGVMSLHRQGGDSEGRDDRNINVWWRAAAEAAATAAAVAGSSRGAGGEEGWSEPVAAGGDGGKLKLESGRSERTAKGLQPPADEAEEGRLRLVMAKEILSSS